MAQMNESELGRKETVSLISSDRVEGTAVYGADDERIGHIDHMMIDKRSGKVSYAVMAFGGFLGFGENLHPLPWTTLTYDPELDGYRVGITLGQLEHGPRAERGSDPWRDPAFAGSVDEHYGGPAPA
jgi:hypothetical protein